MTHPFMDTGPTTIAIDLAAPDKYGEALDVAATINRIPGTTPAQRRAIAFCWKRLLEWDGYGEEYEYACFIVTVSVNLGGPIDFKPAVAVYSSVRLSTPGTIGHAWPATRLLAIGSRGGYTCINAAKFSKDPEGKHKRHSAPNVKGREALRCPTF